jgi:hypothetical protein
MPHIGYGLALGLVADAAGDPRRGDVLGAELCIEVLQFCF